eukprot:328568_1
MSTSSHSRSHSNARLDTIFIHSYPTPHNIINGLSKYCYYVNKYEKTYMFSSRIFILMFLGALYSWIYHNKQQAQEQYDIDDHYIAGNVWLPYTTSTSVTSS